MAIDLIQGFRFGAFTAEPLKGSVAGDDGQSRHLAPKAMDVLVRLAEAAPRPVSREDLITAVWGERYVSDEVLTHAIKELRHALGDSPAKPKYIQTIPKRGYRLLRKARPIADPTPARDHGKRFYLVIAASLVLVVVALGWLVLDPGRDDGSMDAGAEAGDRQVTVSGISVIPSKSIAVLPFSDLSPGGDQEYFSDGVSEEILNQLVKVPGLRVTSRHSAFSFKGQNVDIPTIAARLGVSHVLEGSVRKSGDNLRITAQLIDVAADTHLWSESYHRTLDDVFAIQDEIAQEVVAALQVRLLDALPRTTRTSSEAFSSYLQGRHYLSYGWRTGTEEAEDAFRKAIEIDPDYASAWVGLSTTLNRRVNWGLVDRDTGAEAARQAALRALQLDDSLAEAWAALADIQLWYDFDWNTAEETGNKALTFGPNDARALEAALNAASALGKAEEALNLAMTAVAVNPLGRPAGLLAREHWLMRRYDLAEKIWRQALITSPDNETATSHLARQVTLQGRSEEAWQLLQTAKSELPRKLASVFVLRDLGRFEEARQANEFVIENGRHFLAYQIAEGFAYLGDGEAAFQWLETAYEQRDGGITYILRDPFLEILHEDARWEPLLKRIGLLDAWRDLKARELDETG